MKILADTDNSLYLKADMLANKSISKSLYTFWEPDFKKATSQTLQNKQPSFNSVSLKTIFYSHYQISP